MKFPLVRRSKYDEMRESRTHWRLQWEAEHRRAQQAAVALERAFGVTVHDVIDAPIKEVRVHIAENVMRRVSAAERLEWLHHEVTRRLVQLVSSP